MAERLPSEQEANALNEKMVRQMELARQQRPERRQERVATANERRRICSFCFQPGDHPTPAHCLRALER
jgi:hypothetical protein